MLYQRHARLAASYAEHEAKDEDADQNDGNDFPFGAYVGHLPFAPRVAQLDQDHPLERLHASTLNTPGRSLLVIPILSTVTVLREWKALVNVPKLPRSLLGPLLRPVALRGDPHQRCTPVPHESSGRSGGRWGGEGWSSRGPRGRRDRGRGREVVALPPERYLTRQGEEVEAIDLALRPPRVWLPREVRGSTFHNSSLHLTPIMPVTRPPSRTQY